MFGCWFGPLLVNPRDIEVTPDGKQVVVANGGFLPPLPPPNPQNLGASVTVFDRDQAGFGALVPHPNVGGACVTHWPTIECPQELQGVWGTTQLAIADDRNIYSISRDSPYRVLHHIVRDPATGNLTGDRNWCLRGPDSAAACPAEKKTLCLPPGVTRPRSRC